jgi:hypothetical protein
MMSSGIVQDPQELQPAADDATAGPGGPVRGGEPVPGDAWRQELAEELIGRARSEGVQLTGPGGLLTGITQMVLETALADHLGYDRAIRPGGGHRTRGMVIRPRRCAPIPARCGSRCRGTGPAPRGSLPS